MMISPFLGNRANQSYQNIFFHYFYNIFVGHCDSGSGGSSSERPALLPRPPPSLTKPSIMKYRGKQP